MHKDDVEILDKLIESYVDKMFQDGNFKEVCDRLKKSRDGLIQNIVVYHLCKKIQEL